MGRRVWHLGASLLGLKPVTKPRQRKSMFIRDFMGARRGSFHRSIKRIGTQTEVEPFLCIASKALQGFKNRLGFYGKGIQC